MRLASQIVILSAGMVAPVDALEIADQGQGRAGIRTLKRDGHKVVVDDLQRILKRVTGAKLPVAAGPPQAGSIFVGTRDEAVAGGCKDLPVLANEEILLTQRGECLYLLGGGSAGVSHAVYAWLDRIGCRWFMPGPIGECVSKRPTLVVKPFTYRHAPSFSMRSIWYAWGANSAACAQRFGEWARRNCQGSDPYIHASHNFNGLAPPRKYFVSHREYYSLIGGKRKPRQLCTSNPDVIRVAAEAIIAAFDKNPKGPHTMSLSPNDGDDFCECDKCRALDIGKPDPFNPKKPCVTDRLMVFWNAVAARVAKRYPDAKLGIYAYVSHTAAPQREKVHPSLAPVLTAQQFCTLHSIADPWCASRQKMRETLARWCGLSKNVHIYDYDPPVGHLELPSPLYTAHVTEIPMYHKMGVKGFSWECHDAWAITSPNLWISAQLQWDVTRDPNGLMDSYSRDFFGPAVEPMRRYYDALAACYRQKDVHAGWTSREMARIYQPNLVAKMRPAMNDALASAGRGVLRKRVQMVDMGLRYLEGYLKVDRAARGGSYYSIMYNVEQVQKVLDELYKANEEYMLKTQPVRWLERHTFHAKHYLPRGEAFRKRHEVWVELPKGWRVHFKAESGDPPADWAKPGFDDGKWHKLRADWQWYKLVNKPYTGKAWGRCTFKAPAADTCKDKRLFFYVGSLDERGVIYLNGQKVHSRVEDVESESWCTPFKFEVTGKVRLGEVNTLAVAADADETIGGVWRPIWLFSPKDKYFDERW